MKRSRKIWTEPSVGSNLGFVEAFNLWKLFSSQDGLNRGPILAEFEKCLTDLTQVNYAVTTTSCSSALFLIPKLLNLKKEDEVLIPANLFWTALAPLLERRCKTVIYDVDPLNLNASIKSIESNLTNKTRAIYVQNFGGSPYNARLIKDLTNKAGIYLVEDSAHGLGTLFDGKPIQSYSDISSLSFSTLKNITTLGEGGALLTNDLNLFENSKMLVESRVIGQNQDTILKQTLHGLDNSLDKTFMRLGDSLSVDWCEIDEFGLTLRLGAPAALVGISQLRKLKKFNTIRKNQAIRYKEEITLLKLGSDNYVIGSENDSSNHLFNLYIDSSQLRNTIIYELRHEIGYQVVNRFTPVSFQSVPRFFGHKPGQSPIYEKIFFNNLLSLPIGPRLSNYKQNQIIRTVNSVLIK